MSSPNKNMAQKILTEILKYYNIIPPAVQNATNPHLLQESALDIPQGIPALLAYSERHSKGHSMDQNLMKSLLSRHAGSIPDLRLVALACGLIYYSRPIVGPVLSSAWEELGHDIDEWITGRPLTNDEATAMAQRQIELKPEPKLEPKPNPNHNTNSESQPERKTVSITKAELKELNNFADAVQARLEEAKTRQADMLTVNCDLEDDVERLENDVERLEKAAKDDAAHSDARIQALNTQIDIEKDGRETVWNERENFRLGGKNLKKQLEDLQAEYNELEDDRDEWSEMAEEMAMELQGEINDATTDRDNLQAEVAQLETDKQTLESSLAQKLAEQKASDERRAELENTVAEAAKALSDAAAAKQAQDKRVEELEAFKLQHEKSAAEAESLAGKVNAQADPAAEDVGKADKAQLKRLRVQLNAEQASYKSASKRKQIFRYGCKKLNKELKDLHAKYSMLEDSRNTWRETCEALEKQADVKVVRALKEQIASDNAHNERRIGALETQLGFEKTNREEAQQIARQLREDCKELKHELEDLTTEYENLELSYQELDHMHGAEEEANEEKDEEITNLKAENDRLKADFTALNEGNTQLNAESTGVAEPVGVEKEDESRQNDDAMFQQVEGAKTTDAEEDLPLRRVKSAPLWLPLPHHGDSFDPLYDVSDYGDDDRDDEEDGTEDPGEHQGSHDDEHHPGNNDGDGASEDDKNDDDDPDDGRNGGADKVATDADPAREDHVANPPGLSDDTTSSRLPLHNGQRPEDLPIPELSPRRASSTMNASAFNFVPSVRPERPVPPILPHHQAYIASQQSNDLSAHMPAPKAAGPAEAKNPHVRKINEEVKRLEWRRKSGMPDLVEDEGGIPLSDEALDDMYDRQVTRFLAFAATQQASGSDSSGMSEAKKSGDDGEWSDVEDSDHEEKDGEGDDDAPMLGNYKVTRAPTNIQENNDVSMLGSHEVTRGPAPVEDSSDVPMLGKYKVTRGEAPAGGESGTPKAEKGSGSDGEWSDVEDEKDGEDEEDEKKGKDGGQGDAMPMVGNHEVTRGSTPVNNNDFVAMLGNHRVTRPPTAAKVDSETPKAKEDTANDSQPSSPCPAPKRGLPQQGVATPLAVPQADSPAREPSPAATTEAARVGQPANRRPSNIFPGAEGTTKTHDEIVGDAFAEYVREHGTRKLEDSMWADKPKANTQAVPQRAQSLPAEGVASPHTPSQFSNGELIRAPPRPANLKPQPPPGASTGPRGHASQNPAPERSGSRFETSTELEDTYTTPRVRLPSPPSYELDNPNEIPRVRLPPRLKGFQARPAPVIPETAPSTQGGLEDGPNPQAASSGTRDARVFDRPSKPPYRGSPLRNEIRVTTAVEKNDGGVQPRIDAAAAVGGDNWSPRGNGRGGRGGRGGQAAPTEPEAEDDFKILGASRRGGSGANDGRGAQQAQQAPAQSPPANTSRAEPTTPSAGNGARSPNFNARSRGGGRGGYRQQQGPTGQASTPTTPRAAPASTNTTTAKNNSSNQTPAKNKGATPQPKPPRGSASANSSFKRQQERMAKLAAEREGGRE